MDMVLQLDWKLKLVENQTLIKKMIIEELEKYLRPKLHRIKGVIDAELKTILHNAIVNSAEYKSLKGEKNMAGDESLMGHFGFDDGGNKVDAIVNKWVAGIHSEMFLFKSSANGRLSAGIKVYAINKSYADVLGMPEAIQNTGRAYGVGLLKIPASYTTLLPWLRILLFDGTKSVLMTDHTITFHPKKPELSRSKQAVMVKSKTRRWFIPEPFAGTITDNWVLRVLEQDVYPKMEGLIKDALRRMF